MINIGFPVKVINRLFLLLVLPTFVANAQVYKCKSLSSGAMEYQSSPCASGAVRLGVVDIKPLSPQEEERARQKLQDWQHEQAANERLRRQAEKELQAEQDKQVELNALTRSALAAEQQAVAAQNLAGQVERQNRLNSYNSLYVPRHRYSNHQDGYGEADDPHRRRHGHEGRHERRHTNELQHQQQLGDYGVYRPEGSLGNAINLERRGN